MILILTELREQAKKERDKYYQEYQKGGNAFLSKKCCLSQYSYFDGQVNAYEKLIKYLKQQIKER